MVSAILNQEQVSCSWEGLREGPPHSLAGRLTKVGWGTQKLGPGTWTMARDSAGLILVTRCPGLGLEFPQASTRSTMFRARVHE